jgi:hypothetical protein
VRQRAATSFKWHTLRRVPQEHLQANRGHQGLHSVPQRHVYSWEEA